MKIYQVRNATILINYKNHYILVDPMLSKKGSLFKFKLFSNRGKNPLVDLPPIFAQIENKIDYALITHCQKGHLDHLDFKGRSFLKNKNITTYCSEDDENFLQNKSIKTTSLKKNTTNPFLDGEIQLVNARHGRGWINLFMENGVGYFIKLPDSPSLYLMGDTVLTDEIKDFIKLNRPDFIVAPTGEARFDLGKAIILTKEDIYELSQITEGKIIANHMDSLDHCSTREDFKLFLKAKGIESKFIIPNDGDEVNLNG